MKLTSVTFFQLIVRMTDGTLLLAKEDYVDYYHNVLTLKVKSTVELKVYDLRSKQAEIVKGMNVIALGRNFDTYSLVDNNGNLNQEYPSFGCDELLRSSCATAVISFFLLSYIEKILWSENSLNSLLPE